MPIRSEACTTAAATADTELSGTAIADDEDDETEDTKDEDDKDEDKDDEEEETDGLKSLGALGPLKGASNSLKFSSSSSYGALLDITFPNLMRRKKERRLHVLGPVVSAVRGICVQGQEEALQRASRAALSPDGRQAVEEPRADPDSTTRAHPTKVEQAVQQRYEHLKRER
jgi:hypothetical protein